MGTLRFILAMSVVYGHAGDFLGFPLIPGDTAVQSFYAVSGFYMALVLNEKYRPGSSTYSLFISNRFLRLFPVYVTVLCLTLLLAFALSFFSSAKELPFIVQWRSLERLDWPSLVFLVASQIAMWGQDLYLFLTVKDGALAFWPDFYTAPQPAYTLLPIPQSWTLGLEFSFYLIAPFIVRRSVAGDRARARSQPCPAALFTVRIGLLRRSVVIPLFSLRTCSFPYWRGRVSRLSIAIHHA